MEPSTEKSTTVTNSRSDNGAVISMNGQKLEAVTSLKYLGGNPVQGWHLLSRNPQQDRLSNGRDGQINRDLAKQRSQLYLQV